LVRNVPHRLNIGLSIKHWCKLVRNVPYRLNIGFSVRHRSKIVKKFPKTISIAEKAIKNIVGKVDSIAIRGGTDGAMLSYKGLPCPNLGGGGYNFHGPYEYLCIDEMKTIVGKRKTQNKWGMVEWRIPTFPLIPDNINNTDVFNYWKKYFSKN
jgi:hypothetical protein